MTAGKKFKKKVRERMERTGESYTAARKALLAEGDKKESDCLCDETDVTGPCPPGSPCLKEDPS